MTISIKRTKILATLGPSTSTPEKIKELMQAGANGFRLNFSHGSHEERLDQIKWIRDASEELNRPVAVLQDIQGPKIRLGALKDNHFDVKKGDEIVTIGGLYGIVDEINDQKVVLDVDGVYLTFDRSAIRNRVSEAAPTAQVEAAIEGPTEESGSAIEE
jgi:pyruvate kinase